MSAIAHVHAYLKVAAITKALFGGELRPEPKARVGAARLVGVAEQGAGLGHKRQAQAAIERQDAPLGLQRGIAERLRIQRFVGPKPRLQRGTANSLRIACHEVHRHRQAKHQRIANAIVEMKCPLKAIGHKKVR